MHLLYLALIPVIALLIFIYVRDKKEKEPVGFLVLLFIAGMSTVIPAIIAEAIGELILGAIFPEESVIKAYIVAIALVAPVEEMGKYVILRAITWKNKNFDYSYDAIVYSVFVSLGFAAVENIGYVFNNGLSTAILRMFTAVPGHACFAVFMGFFYSKAKYASVTNDRSLQAKFTALSMIVPIILHGIYDAIVMGAVSSGAVIFAGLSILAWLGFVAMLFAGAVVVVITASKNDFCIVTMPDATQTYYRPAVVGTWNCSCGAVSSHNFCYKCGSPRPMINAWQCPQCGTISALNFCGNCGYRRV